MAGIYIHIPFCKSRCIYCDFFSTTHNEQKSAYIQALCKEIKMRQDYLSDTVIETIYFGGGTPSQLSRHDFEQIFTSLADTYPLDSVTEITVEANPDDLTADYVEMLSSLPFNRISMGIQTFREETLKKLRRRHTSQQAIDAVKRCREAGFHNISIDLIYGLPNESPSQWDYDLSQAIALYPEHISAYHLIYEEGTPLYRLLSAHQVEEIDENKSVDYFNTLIDRLNEAGYEHYEISNFSLPGKRSRHNSSYWNSIPYIGFGPSAHSFNGTEREWNVSDLDAYIQGINNNERAFEREELSQTTRYNECVMTRLRTKEGIYLPKLQKDYGEELHHYCLRMAAPYLTNKTLMINNSWLSLTRKGIFISDSIMSDLLQVDD